MEELAEKVVEQIFTYDDEHILLRIHFNDGGQDEVFPSRIISGAVLAEAVRTAGLRAIGRDLSDQNEEPAGITFEDISVSLIEQFKAVTCSVQPNNVHLYYLDLPLDRRVIAVEHVLMNRYEPVE